MPIDFSMCKKHGAVRHTITSTCNLCASEQAESQTTDTQQLKAKISEFRESLEWYRDNVDREYANGFLNKLNEIQKLSAV